MINVVFMLECVFGLWFVRKGMIFELRVAQRWGGCKQDASDFAASCSVEWAPLERISMGKWVCTE